MFRGVVARRSAVHCPEYVAGDQLEVAQPLTVPADASPALSESAKLRSALMSALRDHISRAHLNQTQAAKAFGVTQPRISDLTRGKVDLFGLDALVNMAAAAGLRVEMRVGAADRPIELR